MNFQRRALRGVAALGLGGAALVLGAAPASAHDSVIVLGENYASITATHRLLTVCDNEDDGRPVHAEVQPAPGGFTRRFPDTYDGAGACSRYFTSPELTGRWRLCEDPAMCSSWQAV